MNTAIYMIRHGQSNKAEGNERTRGLTEKGAADSQTVRHLMKDEGIDVFLSSPYARAAATLEELARDNGKSILLLEELKECVFTGNERILPDQDVDPLVRKMFADPLYVPPGGECLADCEKRASRILQRILREYRGQTIAIGTHGVIMTLMMRLLDTRYDIDFLYGTSKPDIYKLVIEQNSLLSAERLWIAKPGKNG